ncbi:MAG: flavodoxin family protein [Raoultibacter sp.]
MRILAINGSHRKGKCTADLLNIALDEAKAKGAETELIELPDYEVNYCIACNKCLMNKTCTVEDDMQGIVEKMLDADGIILGSPDYFSNVTARMKTFFDRTRFLHMVENQLKGKVGGIVTVAGLCNTGLEPTLDVLERWFVTQEMLIVHPRPEGPVLGTGVTGSTFAGFREDGRIQWRRSITEDVIAVKMAEQLGKDMVDLINKLA